MATKSFAFRREHGITRRLVTPSPPPEAINRFALGRESDKTVSILSYRLTPRKSFLFTYLVVVRLSEVPLERTLRFLSFLTENKRRKENKNRHATGMSRRCDRDVGFQGRIYIFKSCINKTNTAGGFSQHSDTRPPLFAFGQKHPDTKYRYQGPSRFPIPSPGRIIRA